ncbi:MAG TPA: PDZ domain-containing protein, partial [Pirellulales bacterium]|nr:PDZ domain-containing protein [Pirellulales bacterium]
MPATEQSWRNIRTLHVVFAVSSFAMLFVTIWMFSADANREWKPIQLTQQAIDTKMNEWRIIEQKNDQYLDKHDELAQALTAARLEPPDAGLYEAFKASDAQFCEKWNAELEERRKEKVNRVEKIDPYDFSRADAIFKALPDIDQKAREVRAESTQADASAKTAWKAYIEANDKAKAADQAFAADAPKLHEAAQAAKDAASAAQTAAQKSDKDATAAESIAEDRRVAFLKELNDAVRRIKQNEDALTQVVKGRRAQFDEARSNYDTAVAQHLPANKLDTLEETSKNIEANINASVAAQQEAKNQRLALEKILHQITDQEDKAKKAFDDNTGALTRLEKAMKERATNAGKQFLELPIIDAFGSPLKIDQMWLPELTISNNFKQVPRYDRCKTCHVAIETTAAGSAIEPGYPGRDREPRTMVLATPAEPPKPQANENGVEINRTTKNIYGLELTNVGLVNPKEVTVDVVWPKSAAADAGLQSGDVIESINGNLVSTHDAAQAYLLEYPKWGQPIELKVSRGLPNPYATHPRLDLFIGSLSPHPYQKFGCTICHDGQGSATAFKWSSHSPNTPEQQREWGAKYGWFANHDWIYPMFPRRFQDSGCLKCHFDVVELEASTRFPEPPAPKLVAGYEIIRRYGCFGCHEINGFNGPTKRVGPDLRLEPNFTAAAQQLKADPNFAKLGPETTDWVNDLIAHPEDNEARQRLREFLLADKKAADDHLKNAGKKDDQTKPAILSESSQKLESVLKDVEVPGTLRKPGPSLRYVASKLDFPFLFSWIQNPTNFRPTTRMPRFFGLYNHLEAGAQEQPWALEAAKRFEPIEIRAIAEFLLRNSQPFDYIKPDPALAAKASAERGKKLFQTRGCLACHSHADFRREDMPETQADQGPDLSRIGAKLKSHGDQDQGTGLYWLYSWVRQPNHYHARTVMPNLFLNVIKDKDGNETDPAADITAYLMNSQQDWTPTGIPAENTMTKDEAQALFDLSFEYIKEKVSEKVAYEYLGNGIPKERAADLKGDEIVLVRDEEKGDSPEVMRKKMLAYVGRRTIGKYGCAGCHDIPGFEDFKPIGTGLADWGRKDSAK